MNTGIIGEQSDGSLLLPSGEVITPEKREQIIKNSINTPIRLEKEDNIKEVIKNGIASIIISETGSGKTTELQQMIHEVYPKDKVMTLIPLVASTIGTASYVSDVMFAKTGNPYYLLGHGGVGYRTGKGSSEEKRAQLTNNTFGLDYLNLSLGNFEQTLNRSKNNVHIVLDEIHEKGEDFVFYLNKITTLSIKYPGRIKLYLASATVSNSYLDLITSELSTLSKDIPTIRVEGRTFPIETVEDNGADTVKTVSEIYKKGRSVLVFQPGKAEITKTINDLKQTLGQDILIYPFHSEISAEELNVNLQHSGEQKIFVATNAARTGITLDITGVVDAGLEKNQYYDPNGIPLLRTEAITEDAYKQNKGRAGRKEPGTAIYTGRKKIANLNEEAPSSVEIKVDEKKILMELLAGENILKNESNGAHKYLFKPNKKMLNFSYTWMKKAGLITEDEKLTTYGFEVLKLPLSVFNGRIVLESIENGVSDDIIPMVSIIENNGFTTRIFDFNKFPNNFLDISYSDLDVYKRLFEVLSSGKIEDGILNVFANMGIKRTSIDLFKALAGSKKFYEVIKDELESVGLKYKAIQKIDEQVTKIKEYLANNDLGITLNKKVLEKVEKNKKSIISRTLLSGFLHKIYRVIGDKKLKDYYNPSSELEFNQSDTSVIKCINEGVYLGEPFIIGGGGDRDDLPLLSFLTEISEQHLEFYENKEVRVYNDATAYSYKDFSIDKEGNTFNTPVHLTEFKDRQKYLSRTWLPHFMIDKNPYVKSVYEGFEKTNKDLFLQNLQSVTEQYNKDIDPDNQKVTEKKFIEDTSIVEEIFKRDSGIKNELHIDLKFKKGNNIKGSNFVQYVTIINEYNNVLNDARLYLFANSLNVEGEKDKILNSIIVYLEENSTKYSELLIFIKNISDKKSNNGLKKQIADQFKSFGIETKKILNLRKKNSWRASFIGNLKKLIDGGDIKLTGLTYGLLDDKNLLLSDPIISDTHLGETAIILNKEFKVIRKMLHKVQISDSKKKKLFSSLQRLLYSDKRKFNRGIKNFDLFIKELSDLAEKVGNKTDTVSKKLSSINNKELSTEKKSLNILKNNILYLISRLNTFKEEVIAVRETISTIDFENIIYSDNSIYSENFLYTILINIIFEGNFYFEANSKQELKFKSRLKSHFKLKDSELNKLVESIKNYINNGLSGNKNVKLKSSIESFISLLEKEEKKYIEIESQFNENLEGNEFKRVITLVSTIEGILKDLYTDDVIKRYSNKIMHFAKRVHSLNTSNFDLNLKKFLVNFGLNGMIKYGEDFKTLEEYDIMLHHILNERDQIDTQYLKKEGEEEDNHTRNKKKKDIEKRTNEIKDITINLERIKQTFQKTL